MRISDEALLGMRRGVLGATVLLGGSVYLATSVSADDDPDATTTTTLGESVDPNLTSTTVEVPTTELGTISTTLGAPTDEQDVAVPTTVVVTIPGDPLLPLDPDDCAGCGLG